MEVNLFEGLLVLLSDFMLFSAHVGEKNSFPKPLSPQKEQEYLLKAREGDKQAKDILIEHNLRLVVHIVKKYNNYPDVDELISVGSMGLIKGINSYKSDKGTQLATYVARCIENEILMTIRANKKRNADVSIYDTVGTDKDGNEMSLVDTLYLEESDAFENIEKEIVSAELYKIIKSTLDKREYDVLRYRYGLGGLEPHTQREVAKIFGISRSYISRIEKKALQKIRQEAIVRGFEG
ncbi:MAG: RNA polymerase sporulation sigma factor SigK [Clostridia bacterium]|nr:RNA polymerase sporulation sigma factor SigK [Clostridia bacterium]MBR7159417.1 RNA polymerase sporulation sigma factor SigK [Clostridia bacterium]